MMLGILHEARDGKHDILKLFKLQYRNQPKGKNKESCKNLGLVSAVYMYTKWPQKGKYIF